MPEKDMAEMVTKQELINAKRDARDLGKAVNEKVIVSPRYGEDFKSIPLIVEEGEAKITQAAQTITNATASIVSQKNQAAQTITSATESIISQKNQASEVISQAESDVVTAAADVHQRGNQEIINLQNAIDIAAAAGAGANGWTAQLIVDESGKSQQQINNNIAVKILRATEIGLVSWNNPDKMPPYTPEEYEQAYNNGINFAEAVKAASDDGYSVVVIERGNYPLLLRNEKGLTSFNRLLEVGSSDMRGLNGIEIDYNGSKFFTIFDSNNKHQYNPSASSYLAYQLAGTLISLWDSRSVTFKNGMLKGDQYKRSWVTGENKIEQTHGITSWRNNRNIRFENMKFTGFRGDGVNGKPRGYTLENYTMHEWSKGEINASGVLVPLAGAYSSARIDLSEKVIIDNMVQLEAHAARLLSFRSPLLTVSFFSASNSLISQEKTSQSADITLPKDCRYIQFTAFNDERTTDTVTYSGLNYGTALVTGSSKGFFFDERCEFYENHRGGVSNLGSDAIFIGPKFRDIGKFSKLGFPHYGDPTQYAINFEDTYTLSLHVDGIRVTNVGQGVLSNSREFTVKNSTFSGMEWGGVNNYSCVYAEIESNTFEGFTSQSLGAINISEGDNYAQSFAKIKGNTLNGASLSFDLSTKPNMKVDVDGNTLYKGRWRLIGNGKNLTSTNNHINNVVSSGVNSPAFYQRDLLKSEGNILNGTPESTSNIYIEHSAQYGKSSTLGLYEDRFTLNNSGSDLITKQFGGVKLVSESTMVATLTLYTDVKSVNNTVDKWSLYDIEFNSVILRTRLSGERDYRDTSVEIADAKFKKGSFIRLAKGETVAGGKTIYIIKDTYFECDNIPAVFETIYTLKGTCEILFLNCEFVSTTAKSMPLVRAFGSAITSGITAQAIGCKFVNVTNTDSVTVMS